MTIAKIIIPLMSISRAKFPPPMPSRTLKKSVIAVPSISDTTHGRTPDRKALTPLYLRKFLRREAIIKIIINDGNRTGTRLSSHGILSPGRLPVPPRRQSFPWNPSEAAKNRALIGSLGYYTPISPFCQPFLSKKKNNFSTRVARAPKKAAPHRTNEH